MSKRFYKQVGNQLYGPGGYRTGKYAKLVGKYAGGKYKTSSTYSKAYKKAKTAGFKKATVLYNNANTFMPREFVTTLRFWTGPQRLTTAGGKEDVVMRANSPRDPFYDAGGEEAAGFDELMAIYGIFKVVSSSIRLRVINLDTDDPLHICVYPSNSNTDDTATSAFAEPLSRVGVCTAEQGYSTVNNYCTTKEVLGKSWSSDKDATGSSGSDPTLQWYWHTVFVNQSTNALACEYDMSIEYRVVFSGLNKLSQI